MELNEALAELKKAGLICEDTDMSDEEYELNRRRKEIFKNARKRTLTDDEDKEIDSIDRKLNKFPQRDSVLQKKKNAGVWAIQIIARYAPTGPDDLDNKDFDDKFIGYLLPDGVVKEKFSNECMMNSEQCYAVLEKYTPNNIFREVSKKSKLGQLLVDWTGLNKRWDYYLVSGTLKNGKFYQYNIEKEWTERDV